MLTNAILGCILLVDYWIDTNFTIYGAVLFIFTFILHYWCHDVIIFGYKKCIALQHSFVVAIIIFIVLETLLFAMFFVDIYTMLLTIAYCIEGELIADGIGLAFVGTILLFYANITAN